MSAPTRSWSTADNSVGVLLGVPSPEIGQHVETGCGTARLVPVTLLRPVELSHVVAGGAAARAEVAERLCTTGITTAATCPDRPSSDQARWRR